jgi:hypothetical protein
MTERIGLVIILAFLSGGLGCTSIGLNRQANQDFVGAQKYKLIVKGTWSRNSVIEQPLREGMTVQDVVEASGQTAFHRDLEIDILRKANSGTGTVKLPIQFDPGEHRVKYETDYAIYPGDQIIIRPKSTSPMEGVAKMLGPSN